MEREDSLSWAYDPLWVGSSSIRYERVLRRIDACNAQGTGQGGHTELTVR